MKRGSMCTYPSPLLYLPQAIRGLDTVTIHADVIVTIVAWAITPVVVPGFLRQTMLYEITDIL